jgi:uncharacterized membrane protein
MMSYWTKYIFISLALVLLIQVIWILSIYTSLPDTIAIHFGLNGEPDGFGGKASIWILPAVQLGIMALFGYQLTRPDEKFKINWPVKEDNRPAVIRFTRQWMVVLFVIVMLLIAYLTVCVIRVALGQAGNINPYIILVFLVLTLGTVFGGMMWMQAINAGRK